MDLLDAIYASGSGELVEREVGLLALLELVQSRYMPQVSRALRRLHTLASLGSSEALEASRRALRSKPPSVLGLRDQLVCSRAGETDETEVPATNVEASWIYADAIERLEEVAL
ncbi:MAG: hypothetical protein SGPRY_012318 [Prymnesium sp.]